ncbi:MAG: hypothetical protein PHU73_04325 [Patescibacteria group bacterium]|nr:hypothetical protein [Patescibacteria group bacterium]
MVAKDTGDIVCPFFSDVFEEGKSFGQIVGGLFMHNIPVMVLAVILAVAWKREIVGAIAFFFGGILYVGFVLESIFANEFEWYMISWIIIIAGPAFLTSALFWLNWRKKRKKDFPSKK